MTPKHSAINNKQPAFTKLPINKAIHPNILTPDFNKLTLKCLFVFDSFGCILSLFIALPLAVI